MVNVYIRIIISYNYIMAEKLKNRGDLSLTSD